MDIYLLSEDRIWQEEIPATFCSIIKTESTRYESTLRVKFAVYDCLVRQLILLILFIISKDSKEQTTLTAWFLDVIGALLNTYCNASPWRPLQLLMLSEYHNVQRHSTLPLQTYVCWNHWRIYHWAERGPRSIDRKCSKSKVSHCYPELPFELESVTEYYPYIYIELLE